MHFSPGDGGSAFLCNIENRPQYHTIS
jgi:hypothetical protein